ncbi:hypothetical protein D3C72_2107960 [compost metagenome]
MGWLFTLSVNRVMLAPGIHDIEPDATLEVFVDIRHLMAFGPDGRAIGGTA